MMITRCEGVNRSKLFLTLRLSDSALTFYTNLKAHSHFATDLRVGETL